MELQKAVTTLIAHLSQDEDYKRSWQANIAMAFKDEYAERGNVVDEKFHELSNAAATRFLNLLCYIPESVV